MTSVFDKMTSMERTWQDWQTKLARIELITDAPFSAASFLSSRLGGCASKGVLFCASHTNVYQINLPNNLGLHTSLSYQEQSDETRRVADTKVDWQYLPRKRKQGFQVASQDALPDVVAQTKRLHLKHVSHRNEIQSLHMRNLSGGEEWQLATIDGFGHCIVSIITLGTTEPTMCTFGNKYSIAPASMEDGEEGWADIDMDPLHLSRLATCRYFYKDWTLYDMDLAVRRFHLSEHPHAIRFFPHSSSHRNDSNVKKDRLFSFSNLIGCLQGPYMSIWDCRVGERNGRIHHKCYGQGSLYAMDFGQSSMAVAGVDRMVHLLDPRRNWNVRYRWNNCLKYECRHVLMPGNGEDSWCVVTSVDNEMACGYWKEEESVASRDREETIEKMVSGAVLRSPKRLFGFRGDSRWIGFSSQYEEHRQVQYILGLSENGSLYVLLIGKQ